MATKYLIVPGMNNSSENHWQSRWEREYPEKFHRIEQSEWDEPVKDDWIAKIESDVQQAGPDDVVLVAHSLGCSTVAHWSGRYGTDIKGALLVAPSDCETEKYRSSFAAKGFDPVPLDKLAFRSVVVASTDDEWVTLERAMEFADAWGSAFINVGPKGHINPGSGYGAWDEGLELLKLLN